MKSRTLTCITAMTALVALTIPAHLVAQHHRYKLIVIGTFGGPNSFVSKDGIQADVKGAYLRVLDDNGTVTGAAETSTPDPNPFCFSTTGDCLVAHAFRWQKGVMTDLGVLPGNVNSSGTAISSNGLIAGVSENPFDIDPVLGFPTFRGALWKGNAITDLGALTEEGGHSSVASAVNSRGQVIGYAFNATPDPFDLQGVGFQTRAFLWQNGVMQDLGTLGGPDAQPLVINEKGQVVGDSYVNDTQSDFCANVFGHPLTTGAFIWEHGVMRDLGNLGGTCTFATALNNRGQVTGASALTGDEALHPFLSGQGSVKDLGTFGGNFGNGKALNDAGKVVGWATFSGDQVLHAALWSEEGITDLGTLPGDTDSIAFDINARDQIVGVSFSSFTASAFLWERGHNVDLESLLAGLGLQLGFGVANINNRGEIAGDAFDADGNLRAVLLIPCGKGEEGCVDAAENASAARNSTLTEAQHLAMRRMMERSLRHDSR